MSRASALHGIHRTVPAAVPRQAVDPVDATDATDAAEPHPADDNPPNEPVDEAGPEDPPARLSLIEGGASAATATPSPVDSLVVAAVAGEARARDELLCEIHTIVLRYCRGRLGRKETVIGSADDVAQDICLAVVAALPDYSPKGLSFRAFVYGIAAHKVTDVFRAIHRNRSDPVAEIPDAPVLNDGPEQRLLAVELSERLGELLHLLTPRQREVLVLRIAVGLSAEETAQAVDSTPGAVRVTQHRALARLRKVVVGLPEAAGPIDLSESDDPDDALEVP